MDPNTQKPDNTRSAAVCIAAGLVFLAGVVCMLRLGPYLLAQKAQTYQALPYMLYSFSVPPVTYCAAGVLIPAVISLFGKPRVPLPLRVVFLVLGTAFCLSPLLFSLETAAMMTSGQYHQPIFTGLGYVMRSPEFLALCFRHLPFAAGILLFLGFRG